MSPQKKKAALKVFVDYNKGSALHMVEPKKEKTIVIREETKLERDEEGFEIMDQQETFKGAVPGSKDWVNLQEQQKTPTIIKPATPGMGQKRIARIGAAVKIEEQGTDHTGSNFIEQNKALLGNVSHLNLKRAEQIKSQFHRERKASLKHFKDWDNTVAFGKAYNPADTNTARN